MTEFSATPPPPDAKQLSELLDNVEWLRLLARRLARHEADADDLVQRTYLVALRRPPQLRGATIRPWLAKVLRNEARMERRAKGRRVERERRAAHELGESEPPPTQEAASGTEERFRLQRRLIDAVEGLKEPYRATIMAVYFEGLGAAALAKREGVSIRTVESRLRRGREQLRERLDAHFGSRGSWCALALPWAASPLPHGPLENPTLLPKALKIGALAMSLKSVGIGAAALLALLLAWQLSTGVDSRPRVADTVESVGEAAAATPIKDRLPAVGDVTDRSAALAEPAESALVEGTELSPAATLEDTDVRARVLTADGSPWVGQWVEFDPPLGEIDRWRTGVNGEIGLRVELPNSFRSKLAPVLDAWTTVLSREISAHQIASDLDALLVVAPAAVLRARAYDEDGAPIQDATMKIVLPEGLRYRLDDTLNWTTTATWTGSTDVSGELTLLDAPGLGGCKLEVSAPGFHGEVIENVPALESAGITEPLFIVLKRLDSEAWVSGVVVGAQGELIEGARVGLGHAFRITGPNGAFSFHLEGEDGATKGSQRLVAAARGFSATAFEPDLVDGKTSWPDYVELRLEEPTTGIEGVVVDREGRPLPGARVWIKDPTFVGMRDGKYIVAEGLGVDWPRLWQVTDADEDGRFGIYQLSSRDYSIVAMDPRTLALSEPLPVAAGTLDARIQLSTEVQVATLEGTVRNAQGEPIEGAEVNCHSFVFVYRVPGASSSWAEGAETEAVETAADGSFLLENVPLSRSQTLQVLHADYSRYASATLELNAPLDSLELTLFASCEARLLDPHEGAGSATWGTLLDAQGEPLATEYLTQDRSFAMGQGVPLVDGNSPTFWVSDAARSVVFSRDGKTVHTMPVSLRPGQVNELVRP